MRVLDDLSGGRRQNLGAVRDDVDFIRGNCADPDAARRATRGIDVVYHEAAVPSVARSVADPALSHRANATATLTMLVAARESGRGSMSSRLGSCLASPYTDEDPA